MHGLLSKNEPKFIKINETQALMNDFSPSRPGLSYVNKYGGKFNVYRTVSGDQFILRFLHPSIAEEATGVDMIYEIYNPQLKKIRIVAVQYKIWKKQLLYFSSIPNIQRQLDQCSDCFCKQGYCNAGHSSHGYRLPYCIPFLRPTDWIINLNNLISSGWHIPICQLSSCVDYSTSEKGVLRIEAAKKVGLNQDEFESLFQKQKIGSRWLSLNEVENFYKQTRVLNEEESIIIYSQKTLLHT